MRRRGRRERRVIARLSRCSSAQSRGELANVRAEDDCLASEEIARELKEIGHDQVGEASTGVEAVELANKLHPDVVLMDIKMADLDGLEATRRIQESCPTPVIIVTAHESHDLVPKVFETGGGQLPSGRFTADHRRD